jgi:hypothetical protein
MWYVLVLTLLITGETTPVPTMEYETLQQCQEVARTHNNLYETFGVDDTVVVTCEPKTEEV